MGQTAANSSSITLALAALTLLSGCTEPEAEGDADLAVASEALSGCCYERRYDGRRSSAPRAPASIESSIDLTDPLRTVTLAAGADHTCVIVDGALKCFGRNILGAATGQRSFDRGLEATDLGRNLPAVDLGSCQSARKIATGAYHACAILADGRIKCWGENSQGALGLGDTEHRSAGAGELGDALPTIDLGTGRRARALTAGDGYTCAILDDGSVKCWGSNTYGQLGLGDVEDRGDQPGEMGDALPVVALGTGRTAKKIRAGVIHTCAVLDDGSVKCWGYNNYGALGIGDAIRRGDQPGQMGDALPAVDLGSSAPVVELALGPYHTCARLLDRQVKCWGHNEWAQLGLGDTASRGDEPGEMGDALPSVDLGAGQGATAITTGGQHSCALLEDGGVKCWGNNAFGWLGSGSPDTIGDQPGELGDALSRVDLGTGRRARKILATYLNTCAELDNGRLKCWGTPWSGMLGIGASGIRGDAPGQMGDALPEFDLGERCSLQGFGNGFPYHYGCALLPAGKVKCWGSNSYGQLGIDRSSNTGDEVEDMGSALRVTELGVGRSVASVGTAGLHSCALLSGGHVKCWGVNRSGTLGYGDTQRRDGRSSMMGDNLPVLDFGAGKTARALAVGGQHSCVILDDGSVRCWGENSYGQLGLGDRAVRGAAPGDMGDAMPAVDLGTGRSAKALSLGERHSCALLDNDSLKCWGWNLHGQLGVVDGQNRGDEPNEMGDALPAVELGSGLVPEAVYTGYWNTCVRFAGGRLKCWGANHNGQLGLGHSGSRGARAGDLGDALPFIDLGTGEAVASVGIGQAHVCAALVSGAVKCWGYAAFGKLGLGTLSDIGDAPGEMGDALPAVPLVPGQPVLALASGINHNCALLANGALKCWGGGQGGELGIGSNRDRGALLGDMGLALPAVDLGAFP